MIVPNIIDSLRDLELATLNLTCNICTIAFSTFRDGNQELKEPRGYSTNGRLQGYTQTAPLCDSDASAIIKPDYEHNFAGQQGKIAEGDDFGLTNHIVVNNRTDQGWKIAVFRFKDNSIQNWILALNNFPNGSVLKSHSQGDLQCPP